MTGTLFRTCRCTIHRCTQYRQMHNTCRWTRHVHIHLRYINKTVKFLTAWGKEYVTNYNALEFVSIYQHLVSTCAVFRHNGQCSVLWQKQTLPCFFLFLWKMPWHCDCLLPTEQQVSYYRFTPSSSSYTVLSLWSLFKSMNNVIF